MATVTAGSQRIGLLRAALATTGATAATGGLAVHALAAVEQVGHGQLALDAVVAAVVLTLGTVAGGLLATGCALLAAASTAVLLGRSARRIEQLAALLTPAVLRRAVAVTIGTGLGLAAASGVATASEIDLGWTITSQSAGSAESSGSAPAAAHCAPTAPPGPDTTGAGDLVEGGGTISADGVWLVAPAATSVTPVPGRATPAAAPSPAVTARESTASPGAATVVTSTMPGAPVDTEAANTVDVDVDVVTVAAGDSLWTLAAKHLSGGSDAAVAAAWPRWHEENRTVIGADPDLIHPGQRLVVPDPNLPATSDEEQP